ncbi:MAG: c-type cytochrome [Saprospiraceae bacterium]
MYNHTNPYLEIIRAINIIATVTLLGSLGIITWLLHKNSIQPALNEEKMDIVEAIPIPQEPSPLEIGKKLFVNNCATCHNKNMKDNLTGPALGGVTERWRKYPQSDLYNFIRNSQNMIKKRHPRALELWQEYQPNIMAAFSNLTDEQIAALLFYIDSNYNGYIIVN